MRSMTDSIEIKRKATVRKAVKIAAVTGVLLVFAAAAVYLGATMGELLGVIVAAAFIAYLLLTIQRFFEKYMPRWLAAVFSVLVSYGSLIAVVVLLIPILLEQISAVVGQISDLLVGEENIIGKLQSRINELNIPVDVGNVLGDGITYVSELISGYAKGMIESVLTFVQRLPVIALTPILTFYFLKDRRLFSEYFVFLLPVKWRIPLGKMFYGADKVIKGYMKTQLSVAFIVGAATMVGYFIIGVPYALLLGILMGICELIPYFGPIIGAIPACLIVLMSAPDKLLWTIAVVVAVQQIEGNFLSPYLMGAHFDINPVTVIVVLWISGRLLGFAGFIFAIPIYVIIKDICRVIFNKLVKAG